MMRPPGEPSTLDEVRAWVQERVAARDPFRHVYEASERHRAEHGAAERGGPCDVFPSGSGPLLSVLAAASGAKRILEMGCGLGYSALHLAFGSAPDGKVETIEKDRTHAALARRHFAEEGVADRVSVLEGYGAEVLPRLSAQYDLIFSDGDIDEYLIDLEHFLRLLRPGGLLVTSNLFLGIHGDFPGLPVAAAYRERILDDELLLTTFSGGLAISVRR